MSAQLVASIDNNNRFTLLAWNESAKNTQAVVCDPIFDYLEVINAGDGTGAYTPINRAYIDGNDRPTLLGWNDTTNKVQALRCDDDGNLLVMAV